MSIFGDITVTEVRSTMRAAAGILRPDASGVHSTFLHELARRIEADSAFAHACLITVPRQSPPVDYGMV
jgi:hypothetical protein